jgi:NAD+ kinase
MKPLTSFGIVAFKRNDQIRELVRRVCGWAPTAGVRVNFHPQLSDFVPPTFTAAPSEQAFLDTSDVLVSLGGDGTFLSALHMAGLWTMPVVGVNLGGMGFLTDLHPDELETGLARLARGEYAAATRMVLDIEVHRSGATAWTGHALNDAFINRYGKPKLVTVGAWHGDDYITDFRADGLIVATPSGSTAYSLSAGGPIVEPNACVLLLTPICPHSLTERPLILPAEKPVRLVVQPGSSEVMLSADGLASFTLHDNDEIIVSRASRTADLIQLSGRSYFELLRVKLDWSRGYKGRGEIAECGVGNAE